MAGTYLTRINDAIYSILDADWGLHADKRLREMVSDAMGMTSDGTLIPNSGKRIRPLLACTCCGALGGDVERVLPFAAALELLHNFTLVHDDIEDVSDIRHGRPTIWKKHSLALALNAGDYLMGICFREVHAATRAENEPMFLDLFDEMYKKVTFGQHLDISFENQSSVTTADYLGMISGKTVALLRGAMQLGAVAARADAAVIRAIRDAGKKVGIAFQLQDDLLGIWGKVDDFGKSISSDITTKKMTFPILYGVENSAEFADFWAAYDGNADQVGKVADRLEAIGAREATAARVIEESTAARKILTDTLAQNEGGTDAQADRIAMLEIVDKLMTRDR